MQLAAAVLALSACTQAYEGFETAPSGGHGGAAASAASASSAGGGNTTGGAGGSGTGGSGDPCDPWAERFGGPGDDRGVELAAGPDGSLVATGYFSDSAMFGSQALRSAGGTDAYLAKLGPTGAVQWIKQFGSTKLDEGMSVAVDGFGNVIASGTFEAAIDFGDGPVTPAADHAGYVIKFSPTGDRSFVRIFEAARPYTLAVDPSGDILVAGRFHGTSDFGGGPVMADATDVFVAKLEGGTGVPVWANTYHEAADQRALGIAASPSGDVVVVGEFAGQLNLGGGNLSASGLDGFLVSFDTNGATNWNRPFGGTNDQSATGVAVTANGDIVVAGSIRGPCDFGAGSITPSGGDDVFVAKYDATGQPLWAKVFGDSADQTAEAVIVDGSGNAIVTGGFGGTIDLGGGALESEGMADAFVAILDPAGAHRWSVRWGAAGTQRGRSVALGACEAPVILGSFDGTVTGPPGPLVSAGALDAYIASFGPVP